MILGPRATSLVSVARAGGWTPGALPAPRALGLVSDATIVGGRVSAVGGLSQPTGSLRPALLASDPAFAGAQSAVFSGTEWLVTTAGAPGGGATGWTLWTIARFDAVASVRTVLDTGPGGGVPFGILGVNASSAVLFGTFGYGNAGLIADTTAHLLVVSIANAGAPNLRVWLDGTQIVNGSSAFADPFATQALQLGRDHTPWPWAMRGAVHSFGLHGVPFGAPEVSALYAWAKGRGVP